MLAVAAWLEPCTANLLLEAVVTHPRARQSIPSPSSPRHHPPFALGDPLFDKFNSIHHC